MSRSITISRSWKPDTAIVPNTQSRAVDTAPGKHVLDVAAVAQSETEMEPDDLLDDDAQAAVTVV